MDQIQKYWTDLSFKFPGVQTPWSAVFVSWCVKRAGATKANFDFAEAHSEFVHQAILNAQKGVGVTKAFAPSQYAPQPGDIIQNNRSGNHYDFAFAAAHASYESHSAIVVEVGSRGTEMYAKTIGGNESDSVGMKEVPLNNEGFIKDPNKLYISVVQINL
ncbi:DUF2272 domain-containing protein [Caballeronia novacaledonica]|uniref:DUF2272 domain-containing protein n=1 Tax=Caballeronia novacaledonica TaxID=1544861 RepID=A0AA37IHI3_9BURK|nr:DUF2272 domain-containing protein [Caballeronia novacaledonica]GJH29317.1 DUF2272 domain-containing protein [Caballeronia novacaledonica]